STRHRHGRVRTEDAISRCTPTCSCSGSPSMADRTAPERDGAARTTVWLTGQQSSRVQRRGRYVPESTQHPARMLPAIARHAIDAYTEPGELVLDPMCGIGTTLVEAAHLGRDATGVEIEQRWCDLAQANIGLATTQGATGQAVPL